MGKSSSKLVADKHNEQGSGKGLRYGVASMQGCRDCQENAHYTTAQVSDELKDWSFFAVFDGYDLNQYGRENGGKISAYCAEHLLENILKTEEGSSDFADRIRSGFLNLDRSMRTVEGIGDGEIATTAVCAFVTPEQIYIANCGDSRAVLYNSVEPIFGTQVHRATVESEKERVESAGGYVKKGHVKDYYGLSVSRYLGCYKFKKDKNRDECGQIISPEPEVFVRPRDGNDEFLVIACYGFWERMKEKQVGELIRSRLLVTDDLVTIANELLDTCLCNHSENNMTIVLVTFPAAPTPSPEAIEKERNLEREIERLIIKIMNVPEMIKGKWNNPDRCERIGVQNILNTLDRQKKFLLNLNLPPGGNIGTKRDFIERIFQRCHNRSNVLRKFTDEVADVLLDKDGCDYKSLLEQVLEKLKRKNSPNLPSSNNIGTMRGSSPIALHPSSQGSSKRKVDLSDNESPAKKTDK